MNITDRSLSRAQSTKLHGLAVVMMLFHHFFAAPENLTLLYFFNAGWCQKLSWLCKLCVALFAFLSGYGMNSGCDGGSFPDLKGLYKKSFLRIIRLYCLLWIVMILYTLISALCLGNPVSAYEFIMNGLGLLYTYNGSWWYVFFYVILCLIFPIIRIYLTRSVKLWKKALGLMAMAAFAGIFYAAALHLFFPYLLIAFNYLYVALHLSIMLAFFAGILISEFKVYDRILSFMDKAAKSKAAEMFLYVVMPVAVSVAVCVLRILIAPSAAYSTFDFAMIPVLVLAYLAISCRASIKAAGRLFALFGKYSTGMWLTHVLIMGLTYDFVARRTRFVPLFFISEVALSLTASVIVTLINDGLKNLFCRIAKKDIKKTT